ncbi:hypothetical protein ACSBL2_24745 [Pedobacter sp. AW31-3R]|uniref:hypothetical protein n=1 Tax=Pedobacter sp. AW31-3R TaxID=3445781 RepID=UPI003FA0E36D
MYIIKRAKTVLVKVYGLLKYYRLPAINTGVAIRSKAAVINFGGFLLNTDKGRFSFILSQFFCFSGFELVIKLDQRFFLRKGPYKELLLEQEYALTRNTGTEPRTVTLIQPNGNLKKISFYNGYQLLDTPMKDTWYLPFTLHPRFYKEFLSTYALAGYREMKCNMRIFFAGNADRTLYDSTVLKDNFKGIISRVEVLDHLELTFKDSEQVHMIYDKHAFFDVLKNGLAADKFVRSEARTPDGDWLTIMAQANFYICLPGVRMPWSHNAVEAMCVGAIPIIQYGNLFSPPLTHMVDCLMYNTLEELDAMMVLALAMQDEEMDRMKRNVCLYYDTYIATEVIIDKINSFFASDREELKIAIPYLQKPLPI